MKYLGSERVITLPFEEHKTAEDYAGIMLSPLSIKGQYKVIKTVTKYQSYEDSVDYNTFISNQKTWKKDNGYQCVTITGKSLFIPSGELGGNCVILEGYYQDKKYQIGIYHLENVYVKEQDIIRNNTLLGTQGSTGLVLSNKDLKDKTYGTHVHVEVKNEQGEFINPRPFVDESILLSLDPKGDNLVKEDEKKEDEIPQTPPKTDQTTPKENEEMTLLFTCPKDDFYFLKLKKGEKLYLVKNSS